MIETLGNAVRRVKAFFAVRQAGPVPPRRLNPGAEDGWERWIKAHVRDLDDARLLMAAFEREIAEEALDLAAVSPRLSEREVTFRLGRISGIEGMASFVAGLIEEAKENMTRKQEERLKPVGAGRYRPPEPDATLYGG